MSPACSGKRARCGPIPAATPRVPARTGSGGWSGASAGCGPAGRRAGDRRVPSAHGGRDGGNIATDDQRRLTELATLHAIGEILNREPDFDEALQAALRRLVDLVAVDTGWVFLTRAGSDDPHFGGFVPAATVGLPPALAAGDCAALREGSCECEGMFRRGELDEGMNIVHCSRLAGASGDRRGLRIHASVPLEGRRAPVGVLNLASAGEEVFDDETLSLLEAIGAQLGIAYERALLLEQRRREAELLAAREERDRVAREVHDAVSQLLFGADLALRTATDVTDDGQRGAAIGRAGELVSAALDELRSLIELLRSGDLEHGLNDALERLVARTSGTMKVHLDADRVELPEELGEALYRCAQEGVHNAMRHANPDEIWVRLERGRRKLRLVIEDDGPGFPDDLTPGVGLDSIRARVAEFGGRVRTTDRREGGARLEVVVPWPPESGGVAP
jgi:two-component system, NarL family, sensor kinase